MIANLYRSGQVEVKNIFSTISLRFLKNETGNPTGSLSCQENV